jgi:hypothetical protein
MASEMTTFDRYRPAMALFFAAPLIMALIFGGVVLYGGTPVRPELYGPLIFAIPALAWVAAQVTFSGLAVAGCAGRWPKLAATGAMLLAALFQFFAVAAILAGATGTLLVAMAIPTGAISMVCALICWRGRDDRRG